MKRASCAHSLDVEWSNLAQHYLMKLPLAEMPMPLCSLLPTTECLVRCYPAEY